MAVVVRSDEWDVNARLRDMGLRREGLISAIRAAVAAYSGCTANHPPIARGIMTWLAAVARLREEFLRDGFVRDDTANFSTIVHHPKMLKIAVANTDENTGHPVADPTNRSKKGELGRRAALINQLSLPFGGVAAEPEDAKLPGFSTWYLCIYVHGDTVRAELSHPTKIENGYFSDWSERLVLIDSDDGWRRALTPSSDDGDGPEFSVVVTRK